jgi:hypothetical protein
MLPINVSNRLIGPAGPDSETTYDLITGIGSPSMPSTYNLLAEPLNVSSEGSKGTAMAVVSGGGPVEDIVADTDMVTDSDTDSDGLRGCDGVLPDEQPARIAVSAIATAQHNCRFSWRQLSHRWANTVRAMGADAAPLHPAPIEAGVGLLT